jgi:hypothetical protein
VQTAAEAVGFGEPPPGAALGGQGPVEPGHVPGREADPERRARAAPLGVQEAPFPPEADPAGEERRP